MKTARPVEALSRHLGFDDNGLVPLLFGEHDRHLARIEQRLGVALTARGSQVAVSGPHDSADHAVAVLETLYERLKQGLPVSLAEGGRGGETRDGPGTGTAATPPAWR